MTNVYVLNGHHDVEVIKNQLKFILFDKYDIKHPRFVSGDMIDDTDFIADRLRTDTTAMVAVVTDDRFFIVKSDAKERVISLLDEHTNESAYSVMCEYI